MKKQWKQTEKGNLEFITGLCFSCRDRDTGCGFGPIER